MSTAQAGSSYVTAILPGALLWGLGLGLAVTPLTAAVLAAVSDADLGEASAINDAASRLGGVIAIAAVPALVGATADTSLTDALASGYQIGHDRGGRRMRRRSRHHRAVRIRRRR